MREPGILIVRDDGVIVVPGAVPISAALVHRIETLLDRAGAPPRPATPRRPENRP